MQTLQKVRLFSIEQQKRQDAWMNDRPQSPPRIDASLMAERVRSEISRHVQESGEVPAEIHMSYWSVFHLPGDQWFTFPFSCGERVAMIPVVADSRVVPGRVHCVGCAETVRREAVRV